MGNNSWIHPPFFGDIWSHETSETLFLFVIFSILDWGSNKNQCSSHFSKQSIPGLFIWNRIENPTSKHYTNFQILKKHCEKRPTCFQTLTFCRNLGFQKSWICSWIFQGFPTPWISHPMDFGFSGRPRERPTKTKIGRQGRISRLPKGSLVQTAARAVYLEFLI